MKTLIFLSVFVLGATIGQAQQITKLNEVEINYIPLNAEISQNDAVFTIKIEPRGVNNFVSNPIGFLNENFDIHQFINKFGTEDYDSYVVQLKSSKGSMVANYDREGHLLSTRQNFKDILMPYQLRMQVYNENKGWGMKNNKYIASTKGMMLTKAIYKITLINGNQKRNIRIDALDKDYGVVARN
ncbi:hypothetical protein [Gelidibacter sp.]|uniref:hypothetical protein n=1 Tax=Gelidibacter sp. TaxID=2018083 RepID=UPI002BF1EAA3|nr:hypothetical protein [Gelidibacter sp.]HUH29737.1 hypothetical protein [Gelidibacter sp.]